MEVAIRASWLPCLLFDISEYRLDSLPYRARCCRAIKSRRSSSGIAVGLTERSGFAPGMSKTAKNLSEFKNLNKLQRYQSTYFCCIAALGGSSEAHVLVEQPFYALLEPSAPIQSDDFDYYNVGLHRSSGDLLPSETGRFHARLRSDAVADQLRVDLETVSLMSCRILSASSNRSLDNACLP